MVPSAIFLIAFPVASFLALLLFGTGLNRTAVKVIGCGGIMLSAGLALVLLGQGVPEENARQFFWSMLPSEFFGTSGLDFALYVDSLSMTMAVTVAFVSALIALYSSEYMADEEGLCRFFAAVNLFVGFMLLLVLGDNLWLLFIGWEGVGLCSYLLIGFYHREPRAVSAAMKAFLTTRVGDVFLLFGMFICFYLFGTLDIQMILAQGVELFPDGSVLITIAGLCLLGGAVGKSAQIPLQTWLADAMWGPTPVSALIHAATMVTAGVYLIARMYGIFLLSIDAQMVVTIVGLATLTLAGIAALVQTDMKRVLAYSTMSQIGYMFVALGASAYHAAIFHLVTHAFFKALLFLSAGVVGHALHTYDLRQMGGLRKQMPGVFWLFVIGLASLIGLPLVSAGFFSKEWIMAEVFRMPVLGPSAFFVGVFGAFLTGLYSCRLLMMAFFGKAQKSAANHSGFLMMAPLAILAIFSLGLGWLETPHLFGDIHFMSAFLSDALPKVIFEGEENILLLFTPTCAALLGSLVAIWVFRSRKAEELHPAAWKTFLKNGWGFEAMYNALLVNPFKKLSYAMKSDFADMASQWLMQILHGVFRIVFNLHSGRLTHYVSFLILSALALASVMVFS